MDTQKTKVIFRKWKKAIDSQQRILAIFPEEIGFLSICDCESWELVDEFGESDVWSPCNLGVVIKSTELATELEYQEEKNFLENHYGYNLTVLKRIPRTAEKVRKSQLIEDKYTDSV